MRAWMVSGVLICALAACGGDDGGADGPGQDALDAAGDVALDEGGEPDAVEDAVEDIQPDPGPEDVAPDADDVEDVQDVEDVDDAADVDGTADVDDTADTEDTADVPPEPLVIDADVAADLCAQVCIDTQDSCGLEGLGGSVVACTVECQSRLAEDGWWLGGYFCHLETCDLGACGLDTGPLTGDPACDVPCQRLDACDFLSHASLPADQPDVCRAVCTGSLVAGAEMSQAIGCIGAALEESCDATALGGCLGEPIDEIDVYCGNVCGDFFQPGSATFCAEGSELRATWPSATLCKDDCVANADSLAEATRIAGCATTGGCADPTLCLSPPADPIPTCEDACTALEDLCAAAGDPTAPDGCVDLCTGALAWSGDVGTQAPGACVEAAAGCPADDAAKLQLAVDCSRPAGFEHCHVLCPELVACLPDSDVTFESCLTSCAGGELVTSTTVAEAAQCALDAPDCAAVAKCVQGSAPDPVCAATCEKLSTVCELPTDTCQGDCEDELEAADGSLADVLCRLYSPCDDQAVCDGLGAFETPAACAAACAEAPGTCGDYADGCESACVGALTGNSLTVGAASCVVDALGATCDVEAVPACAQ